MADFNPKEHLIALKGKLYLETRWRVQWFRADHPQGCITTEVLNFDPVLVKATVYDGEARILATAHAGAKETANAVWSGRAIEKAETAAIGRALGHAGYGTQFASEGERHDEKSHLADSPVAARNNGAGKPDAGRTRPPADAAGEPAADKLRPGDDLRDRDTAGRFIQRWRAQALSDADVLAALGVTKLSEWTHGKTAADAAVGAWLAARAERETA